MRAALVLVFVPILAPACHRHSSETTTTAATAAAALPNPAPPQAPAPSTATVQPNMAQHFASSMALLGTTVIGNPAAFHEAATFLEDREIPANASEAWNLKLEPMRAAAAHATSAKSLEDAARSIGELGAACASCHRALGGPHVDTRRPPPRGSSAKVEAARHAWAAELMWEGLSAPSDEAWTTGARALEQARLEPEVIASAASVDLDVTALSRRAHESGKKGRSAKDDAARAKAVAEAYATCAHCHRRLGVDVTRPRR